MEYMTSNEEIRNIKKKKFNGKPLWKCQTDGRKIQSDVSMCVTSMKFAPETPTITVFLPSYFSTITLGPIFSCYSHSQYLYEVNVPKIRKLENPVKLTINCAFGQQILPGRYTSTYYHRSLIRTFKTIPSPSALIIWHGNPFIWTVRSQILCRFRHTSVNSNRH